MTKKITLLGGAALLAVAGLGMTGTEAQAKETYGKGAPEFSDPDGAIKFKVRGRVQYDVVSYDQDLGATANDKDSFQTRARRVRLGVEGQYNSQWKYKAEVTLLGRDTPTVQYEDVYVEYAADKFSIIVGNQDQGYTLERLSSSRFITNMERNMGDQAWGFSRTLGIGVVVSQDNWGLQGFINGDSPNNTDLATGDEQIEGRVHGWFTPINTPTSLLYVGGTARYRDLQDSDTDTATAGQQGFRYRARPETNTGDRLADTGGGNLFTKDTFYSAELAGKAGPFYAQGEYDMLNAEGPVRDNDFTSYFVQAGWFLTGESRNYVGKSGKFDRLTPNNPVNEGGLGAWELRGRYDYLDLDDGVVDGGTLTTYTVGINWTPIKFVRFMGEYVNGQVEDRTAITNNGDFDAFQFRAQFDW
jgi:phosphate-selective porin OprO/OprP